MEKNKPIQKFRSGTFECAIWENNVEGKEYKVRNLSLKKSIKKEDKWEDQVINLRYQEIRRAIKVLEKAEDYLLTTPQK